MRRRLVAAWVVLTGSLLFQSWFLGLWPAGKPLDDARLSTLYTQALADGRSHLSRAANPHLRDAPDPFAPALAPYRTDAPLDVSIYRGHYYLYFGIVPFVGLFVPWTILTGGMPTPGIAILCFCGVGYLAYGGLLLTAAARWFPKAGGLLLAAAFAALIASSGTWPLMSRPAIYEVENAAAFACFGAALFFWLQAEGRNARRRLALSAAAAGAALCLGCRPNYFPAVTVLLVAVLLRAWNSSRGPAPRARLISSALALAPAAAIGFGLAWWNYHRFDNPLDFGLEHTVSSDPAVIRPLASWSNLPYGLHRYALGAARLIRYFPFIQGQQPGPFALGPVQEPSNQVYGFLLVSPLLLLALLPMLRRKEAGFGVVPLLAFFGNLLFLSAVTMSCYRYPADFLGPLGLLAAGGILSTSAIGAAPWRRLWQRTIIPALLAWSLCALLFQTFSTAQTTELFDLRRPADFSAAGRPFNALSYLAERVTHRGPQTLAVTVSLPLDRFGQVEPLVVVGENGAQDFLYLNYVNPTTLQLGFESLGRGGLQSTQLKIDYRQPHRFELRYGSFLPPPDHPLLRNMPASDLALARRMITVLLDDAIVLDGWADFHLPRARIFVGSSPDDPAFGAKFTGRILGLEHPAVLAHGSPPRWTPEAYGPLKVAADIRPMPTGVFDPLVSCGHRQQGAQLLIEHLENSRLRLVWLDTSGTRITGDPFDLPPGRAQIFEIEAGALLPPLSSTLWPRGVSPAEKARMKTQLRVAVGGSVVLEAVCRAPDASPVTVAVGQDTLFLIPQVMPLLNGASRVSDRAPPSSSHPEKTTPPSGRR